MTRRPGKSLTSADLHYIREQAWAVFMEEARELARERGKRVRVVGVRLRPRPRPWRPGEEWVYVLKIAEEIR